MLIIIIIDIVLGLCGSRARIKHHILSFRLEVKKDSKDVKKIGMTLMYETDVVYSFITRSYYQINVSLENFSGGRAYN